LPFPADVDECAEGIHRCDTHARCINTRGNYTCACRGELGFDGDGYACADVRPPTITLSALVVSAAAPADGHEAPATFPTWTLSDNLTPATAVTVACTANLTGGATADPVTSGPSGTPFPVGTTAVSCVASDGALNPSPPAVFSVVVGCGVGYVFRGGKCTGERREAQAAGRGSMVPTTAVCARNQRVCVRRARVAPRAGGRARADLPTKPSPPLPSAATPLCPRPDGVPPSLAITGATPLVAFAVRGSRKAVVPAGFPEMSATDPNGTPSTLDPSSITCNATIDGVADVVTAATPFPYGVTVVSCAAADAAGNLSPAVSFAVDVACEYGASVRTPGGNCLGEFLSGGVVHPA
jgi:hypothetical protein